MQQNYHRLQTIQHSTIHLPVDLLIYTTKKQNFRYHFTSELKSIPAQPKLFKYELSNAIMEK